MPDKEGLWLGVPYFYQVFSFSFTFSFFVLGFSLDFIQFYNEVQILSALVFKLVASFFFLPFLTNTIYSLATLFDKSWGQTCIGGAVSLQTWSQALSSQTRLKSISAGHVFWETIMINMLGEGWAQNICQVFYKRNELLCNVLIQDITEMGPSHSVNYVLYLREAFT